jgi:glycosyltransferase involved in cell wall biosynthesis
MSQCNAQKRRDLAKNHAEYEEGVNKKLLVIPPPQKLFLNSSDNGLSVDGVIKFMLVGASFFRKGGMEIIETFKKIREQFNYPLELTIVSSLTIDNYATKEGPEDVAKARNMIEQNLSWIRWYPKLKNDKVIELMKSSHVGLLPTYADTYGFSVLEFQAAGCPCITTNVRALPEINDSDTGWVIDVPKHPLGEAIYATKDDRNIISKLIRNGLENAVKGIFTDRSIIAKKAEKSIARIKKYHSPEEYSLKMQRIYSEALSEGK